MKLKKIFSATLAIIITISFTNIAVFAQELTFIDEEQIDAALIERGYPQIVVEEMSLPAKKSIYDDSSLYFKGAAITTYDEDTGMFENYEISDNSIMPCGDISTKSLSLVWAVSGYAYDSNLISVKYSYEWKRVPFFRWQDPVAVSWDSSLFEMKDNSFHKVDYYDGFLVNSFYHVNGGIHAEEYGYAKGFAAGVTWYADLKGYTGINIDKLYGYGEFVLRKKTSTSGYSTLYGHYIHPTVSISLSINISSYGSFSASGGSGYDERGNQVTFRY